MNPTSKAPCILTGIGLALSLACGGGSSSDPVTPAATAATPQLVYSDATTGPVQLHKNTTLSTSAHLVMDVVGVDSSTLSAGLYLTLNVEPTVAKWAKVKATDGDFVENGTVYTLGSGVPLLKAKVSGGTLTFAVGQKGFNAAVPTSGVLARVALDLQPESATGLVVFTASSSGAKLLTDGGVLVDFPAGVGALRVQ